jgi:hypothetical protein
MVRIILTKENIMLELTIPIMEVIGKSTINDMVKWFEKLPTKAAWYVISDYCFGDKDKKNDTVSFSILLNHGKLINVKEYINAFAPKDIKNVRNVSQGFLQYINSPVIFNITFIIDRNTKFLKEYATVGNMRSFLPPFRDFVNMIKANSPVNVSSYFDSVVQRIDLFEKDFSSKNFNAKLSRQIYFVSAFVSLMFYYLTIVKNPSHIAWVSDRDALIERYDEFAFDLAYFMFLGEYSNVFVNGSKSTPLLFNEPNIIFLKPDKSGKNDYDELVRIPDYLAGTLADLKMDDVSFSKDKYYTVLYESIANSPNHAILHVYGNANKLSCRRIGFRL